MDPFKTYEELVEEDLKFHNTKGNIKQKFKFLKDKQKFICKFLNPTKL